MISEASWNRLLRKEPSLKLNSGPQLFAADDNQMQVLGNFVCSLTFSNGKSFTWPLVVVKNLTADGFVGSDLMKEAGAITDHSTNSVYFGNNNCDTSVKFEGCSRMPLEAAGQIQEVMHNPRVHLTTDVYLKAGCRWIICIEPIETM